MGKIVVKIGGVASDNLTEEFFETLADWQAAGKEIVIVHGGGYYITEMMEKLNVPVTIANGLRVTSAQALKITQMVLIGQVQPAITTVFQQNGFSAVGLHASCGQLIQGTFIDKDNLGYVGTITNIGTGMINDVLAKNHVPIIAPLGLTEEGEWLNINADTAACKIAEALDAEALYLITDVPGVKCEGEWLEHLTADDVEQLKDQEVITGGMIPKLDSATSALTKGVKEVFITNSIAKCGTKITKAKVFA
ncbi:acetylglutamate kinase [Enterococcus sp. AZ072]|uniref:acetylglutamate kinase n=1 Tax=unclassified Enterococcus TaxID=2608891 RepID=UPI003D27516E